MCKKLYIFIMLILVCFVSGIVGCSCFKAKDPDPETNPPAEIKIYFEQDSYSLELGDSCQLVVKFVDENATDKTVTWISENPSVASVDANGYVTTHEVGGVSIIATSSTGYDVYCYIDVGIYPTSIVLDKTEIELIEGDFGEFTATILPDNCTNTYIGWESSDENIAFVNYFGDIYANNPGTVTITGRTVNGLTASIVVTVKPYIKVSSVVMNHAEYNAIIPYDDNNIELLLTATVYPSNATYPEIVWSSTNESIATVDDMGNVNIVRQGTVYIEATTKDNIVARCKIVVQNEIVANSINITNNSLSLVEGNPAVALSVTFSPYNTTYKDLLWTSSNESVATVNSSGEVTPKSVGSAVITAISKYGKRDTCVVTVTPRIYASSVVLDKTTMTIEETKTGTLVATVMPNNTTDKSITWSSNNTNIATVDNNGKVTGVGVGTTTIVATTVNSKTAECKVVVEELKVRISVIIDGEVTDTLLTCKSQGYIVNLPAKPEDITTNSSVKSYFYGWFADQECSEYLSNNKQVFESDSAIYAKKIVVNESNFSIDISDPSEVAITKFNNTGSQDIVVVPDTIRGYHIHTIKAHAFNADSVIKTIVFPRYISLFNNNAINNCSQLEQILIYENSPTFTKQTINYCSNVQYNAYGGLKYLGTLDNPYMIVMGADSSVKNVTLSQDCCNVNTILSGMNYLQTINVDDGNKFYSAKDGILYNKAETEIICVPNKIAGDIVIPSTIESIAEKLFLNRDITAIDLGGNVRKINTSAFSGCRSLTTVTGTDSVQEICNYAFNNTKVSDYEFTNNLNRIGQFAFSYCRFTSLNIPNSVQTIDSSAFANCNYITEVTLPFVGSSIDAVDANNRYPFGYIFSHDYTSSNSTKISQSYLLSGRKTEKDFYIPGTLNKITITGGEVYYGAFSGCKNVSITICYGVKVIQDYAFNNAELNSLTLPKTITSIGNKAMANCTSDNLYYTGNIEDWCVISFASNQSNPAEGSANIYFNNNAVTEIVIPNSITEIKDYVFIGFKQATEIMLHSNIASIGEYAFKGCVALEEIEIPTKITVLNNNVFENCSTLQSVVLNNGLEVLGYSVFKDCSSLLSITIPNTVKDLGSKLFSGCTKLNSVVLSNSIDCIPSNTFDNCVSLASIDIPDSVVNIYSEAFKNCTSLHSLELTNENLVISEGIIAGCSALESLVLPNIGTHGTGLLKNYLIYYFGTDSFDNSIQYKWNTKTYYIPISLKTLEVLGGTLYENSLRDCTNLETLIIGENVVELSENSLYNCANLKNLIINAKSLANISGSPIGLLGTNTDGTTITFGKTAGNIPSNLMKVYTNEETVPNISNIIIAQDGVLASIGDYAFAYCQDLSTITIPSTVTLVGTKAFYKCSNLSNIIVNENSDNYSSIDGNLYNKEGTHIIQYALGKSETSFEVSNAITNITAYAFDGAENINKIIFNTDNIADMTSNNHAFEGVGGDFGFEVVIGPNVVRVPNYLFNISDGVGASVTSLEFDVNSKCTTIGSNAFANCNMLSAVQMPNSVASIGSKAFYLCENISTLEFSGNVDNYVQIEYVDSYSNPMLYANNFTINGNELKNLVLSSSVLKIADYALYNHTNIETIIWSDNITSIGSYAFYNCYSIQEMIIPSKVTSIGARAFVNCAGITKLYIPRSVLYIPASVLNGCSSIQDITIPYVGRAKTETASETALFGYIFGETAFDNTIKTAQYYNLGQTNISATYYYIPRSITKVTVLDGIINNGAFSNCKNIVTINYGDTVHSIGEYAYYNCEKLSQVNFNDTITTIGNNAFNNCISLNNVVIGNGVETIGNYAFRGCEYISSIDFGQSLTSIGDYAFYNCSAIAGLDLPSSLQSIGQYAFYNCVKFLSVTLGTNMKTIGERAFEGCLKLVEVFDFSSHMVCTKGTKTNGYVAYYALVVHTSKSATSVLENIDGYLFVNDVNNTYLISCEREDENLVLPTRDNNYSINAYAFSYLPNLKTVILPSSVNGISNNAFYKCSKLIELTVTKSVTEFPMNFMFECGTLSYFNYVGSVEDWLNLDFIAEYYNPLHLASNIRINGEKVTSYTIASGTTAIKPFAFYKFNDLVSVTIPESVTEIGASAFRYCSQLQSVDISNVGLKEVGVYAFGGCRSLRSFKIPYTLESISSGMFAGCESLGNINIPSKVNKIESCAFENCKSITEMTIPSTVSNISFGIFGGCVSLERLTIPRLQYSTNGYGMLLGALFSNSIGGEGFNAIEQSSSSSESDVYYIPASLTKVLIQSGEIIYGALHGCSNIVTISNGVSKVDKDAIIITDEGVGLINGIYYKDNWAMSSIGSLANVILKSGTVGIADGAFENVPITSGVTTVDSLKYIGDRAFKNTTIKSISLYNNLITIGDEAFYQCANLSSITIPSTVVSIGDRALYGCSYLSAINVNSGNTAYVSVDGNLYNANMTTLIKYASGKLDTTFAMPNTVLTIEEYAFMDAKSISDITFSTKLQYVNEGAFYGCEDLRYATLPIAVKYIGDYAFYGCSYLSSVTIDISVREIGAYAFAECSRLEKTSTGVTFVNASGWVVQSSPTVILEETNLSNVKTAAYYLVVKHYKYAWKRS